MQQEEGIMDLYREYYLGTAFQAGYFAEYLNGHPAIGLYHEEQLVGFCLSRRFAPDILEIAELYVAKAMRNKSLGKYIVEEMHATAQQQGYKGIILSNSLLWSPQEAKQAATSFYEKMGYQRVFATDKTNVWAFTL